MTHASTLTVICTELLSHTFLELYTVETITMTHVLLSHAFLELYAQRMLILCLKDMRACLVTAVCDDPKNTYSHFNELNYLKKSQNNTHVYSAV